MNFCCVSVCAAFAAIGPDRFEFCFCVFVLSTY